MCDLGSSFHKTTQATSFHLLCQDCRPRKIHLLTKNNYLCQLSYCNTSSLQPTMARHCPNFANKAVVMPTYNYKSFPVPRVYSIIWIESCPLRTGVGEGRVCERTEKLLDLNEASNQPISKWWSPIMLPHSVQACPTLVDQDLIDCCRLVSQAVSMTGGGAFTHQWTHFTKTRSTLKIHHHFFHCVIWFVVCRCI